MNERGCPPDYNGGFCADYDVDCKACWEQWEQEHKAEEGDCNTCINGKLPSYSATCIECGLSRKNYKSITNVEVIEVDSSPVMVTGTTCQICDEFIPLYGHLQAYSRICNECKKRLKKLLYGESEDE